MMGVYRTIVADPPWAYPEGHVKTLATGRSHNVGRDGSRAGQGDDIKRALPYDSLTVAEIEALPVAEIAAGDVRLFLWTTNRYLPGAFDVLRAWGFAYRQTLVWHKTDGGPFPASVAVEQVSPGPYAELFARRARFGWDYPLGDQALGGVAAMPEAVA